MRPDSNNGLMRADRINSRSTRPNEVSILRDTKMFLSDKHGSICDKVEINGTNLLVEDSVECAVLVDVHHLLVPELVDVDRFTRIEPEAIPQLLHLVVQHVYLILTAID